MMRLPVNEGTRATGESENNDHGGQKNPGFPRLGFNHFFVCGAARFFRNGGVFFH